MTEHVANHPWSTEYRVTTISNFAAFISFLAIMLGIFAILGIAIGVAVSAALGTFGIVIAVLAGMAAVIVLIRFLLTRLLVQKLAVTLMKDGVDVRCLYKPFFDRIGNVYIHISDISSYQVYTHPAPRLTLMLRKGGKIRLAAPNIGDNSQLALFVNDFAQMVERAAGLQALGNPILRKKTIYEGTSGMVIAIFFMVVSIAMLYAIFFMPDAHETKDVIFGLGIIVTGLGYVAHIFSLRKKKKQQKP